MKSRKHRTARAPVRAGRREREVLGEMENFLRALSSYPDRFAREPYLSFEQHLFSIVASGQSAAGDVRRRD
jgi:hypothetical protein